MRSDVTLRGLERRDLNELVTLCREHAAYERAEWHEHERTADLERLLLDSPDAHCWVVQGEAELGGFATAALELSTWNAARYLHLDCLYLRPHYRGKGLGRALMAEVAAAAVALGALELQWQTPTWNTGAVRFYDRLRASSAEKLRFTLTEEDCRALARERAGPSTGA